jgi:hypothetical protein
MLGMHGKFKMFVGPVLPTIITNRVLDNEWSSSTALFNLDTVSLKLKCDHQMCRFTRFNSHCSWKINCCPPIKIGPATP